MHSTEIDDVQSFIKAISDNDNLWNLLVGREISRFNDRVKYRVLRMGQLQGQEIMHFDRGKVHSIQMQENSNIIINVEYTGGFQVRYTKSVFVKQFHLIFPAIFSEELLDLLNSKQITKEIKCTNSQVTRTIDIQRPKLTKKGEESKKAQEQRRQERQENIRLETQRRVEEEIKRIAEREANDYRLREQQQQEQDRRESEKQISLNLLKNQFKQSFLTVHDFHQNNCTEYLSFEEYRFEKLNYVKSWVQEHLVSECDLEQAEAIATVEKHVQVVARAGSGKTLTLVNRALFLQKHCGVAPDEILLLAFNKQAVEGIRQELSRQLQDSAAIPHVMTFHSLAYTFAQPKGIIYDEPEGEQSKSRALQEAVIDKCLQIPDLQDKIRTLLMVQFRQDWEHIILNNYDKNSQKLLQYLQSLNRESIDGTYVKSFGEKVIANFFFEHNIAYDYEKSFTWWNATNYRPDFTLKNEKIVVEYFGMQGDPDYDALSGKKRKYWKNKPEWQFIEAFPNLLREKGVEGFCTSFQQSLENAGVRCNRLSEEEIWQKIKDRRIRRSTRTFISFIQRCRQLSLTPEQLAEMVNRHICITESEQIFLELAQIFYKSYLEHLQVVGKDDFDGVLMKAMEVISTGKTKFFRPSRNGDLKQFKYIFIDEYQDFSTLFYGLIEEIRSQNSKVLFFCVGDDWQSINGFAGSDLRFYRDFAQYFQPSQKCQLSTNYRSQSSIVEISNILMEDLGTPARANSPLWGSVTIANLGDFELTVKEQEDHREDRLAAAVLRVINKVIKEGKDVVLLSRQKRLPESATYGRRKSTCNTLDGFLKVLHSHIPTSLKDNVYIDTVHKYKGLQKDVVIVLDAIPSCYPLLHPDMIFTRIFGDTTEKVIEEERRLFYVALTRAAEHLFIFTDVIMSPFLNEINSKEFVPMLVWSNYLSPENCVTVKIRNQNGRGGNGTYKIHSFLKNEKYLQRETVAGINWCRTYPAQGFSVQQFFTQATWCTSLANGIEVCFYGDSEKILAIYQVDVGKWTCIRDDFLIADAQPHLYRGCKKIPKMTTNDAGKQVDGQAETLS
jgi:DNA helicase IV